MPKQIEFIYDIAVFVTPLHGEWHVLILSNAEETHHRVPAENGRDLMFNCLRDHIPAETPYTYQYDYTDGSATIHVAKFTDEGRRIFLSNNLYYVPDPDHPGYLMRSPQ